MTKISVNGEECPWWPSDSITYEELVAQAGLNGNPTAVYTSPRNGDVYRHGCLHRGQTLTGIDGMRFTVCHTGNA